MGKGYGMIEFILGFMAGVTTVFWIIWFALGGK
jgi:hypothetical protein